MTTQIAVRLPDELVAYLDSQVQQHGGSRASIVSSALQEIRRRELAERDAEILRTTGDYDDFEALGSATVTMTDLD